MKRYTRTRHLLFILCAGFLLINGIGCSKTANVTEPSPSAGNAAAASPTAASPTADTSQTAESSSPDEKGADYYGDYLETGGVVALVTDCSSIMDNGFNQAAYEGAKTYAQAAGVSYSYYSAVKNSPQEYENVLQQAVSNHAKLIICASAHFEQALGSLQDTYPDVHFLMLDGIPKDDSGKELPIASNVHCISYHEEEAGYLAGYMTVMDGYTRLGFIGGEKLPAIQRYGTGFLQGVDAAAEELGISNEVTVNYQYFNTFLPDEEIKETAAEWYDAGTEVIFACGGSIYESVLSSAEACNGLLIGADTDQSSISTLFLTSAMKDVKYSVIMTLDDYFACGNTWPKELSGQMTTYGVLDRCIGLPISDSAWRFQKVTYGDYTRLFSRIRDGEIKVSADIESELQTAVHINYHNNQ